MNPNSYSGPGQPYQQPQQHAKHRLNVVLILLIITGVLLLTAIGFGLWAFSERNTYKTKTDEIVALEVELAKQQTASEKDKEFIEKEKEPFKQYEGPSQFASLKITYPKTWSAFITENDRGAVAVDGYLHPDWVPGAQSGTSFALRFQVLDQTYDSEMKKLEPKIKAGKVQASPYRAKSVPDILGSRITGEVNTGQSNIMVLLPVRDKTIKIWTESESYFKDFDNIILSNLLFSP